MVEPALAVTLPASFAQQRLWFLDQVIDEPAAYNFPTALRLCGPLEPDVLRTALQRVVDRHEVLRTTFPAPDGEPVQRIAPSLRLPWRVADLTAVAARLREPRVEQLVAAESVRRFDLATGPLLRALLIRRAPEDHVLVLVLHHIVCDGWSVGLVYRELEALYPALLRGEPDPLPPLPIQYGDYAAWQRERLGGDRLTQELSWWRERLAGLPTGLDLPTDRPRSGRPAMAGAAQTVPLPDRLVAEVKAAARARRTTPFAVLLAGYGALLSRLARQPELAVGIATAGRDRSELEPLVGFFVNTLPVPLRMTARPTFGDLVDQLRTTTLTVLEHAEVPFERLVADLRAGPPVDGDPLVQTLFSAELDPPALPALPGLTATPVPIPNAFAKFDLGLSVERSGAGHLAVFSYRTSLFDPGTVRRIGARYVRLLIAGLAEPDTPIARLPLLAPDERAIALGARSAASPPTRPLHALLAERAAATPEAIAVSGSGQLRHGEMHAWANRLAHLLRARGAGPDTVVAVHLPRGVELLVALLGVLKAGACYLPLPPDQPPRRRSQLLADAGVRLLVTDPRLAGGRSGGESVAVAGMPWVGVGPDQLAGLPDTEPPCRTHWDHLAYVVFTSGSTGRPKPVAVPHRALANHATAIAARYRLGPDDAVLQFADIGFDTAAEEIYPTWLAGGRVVVVPDAGLDSAALTALLERERVTVINLPTGVWRQLTRDLVATGAAVPSCLRLAVVGSEAVDTATLAVWRRHTGVPVLVAYGVTEAAITATVHDPAAAPTPWPTAPIGRPIGGVEALVLDDELQPAPIGVCGELYLGGAALARGYLGRPDLTAERFVPHPHADDAGRRLYRTGDLASRNAGGELVFLGRTDDQIKIRGHRVEPAEVVAALTSHPAVRAAAVDVRRSGAGGDPQLVGYLVGAPVGAGEPPDPAALRAHLAASLPAALVPDRFVVLDRLPLTRNGKLDRAALPDPAPPPAADRRVAPFDPMAAELAVIWRDLLGVAEVGVHDHFFDLGGHSLLLAKMRARIAERLGHELPMVALYEHPTIAALARHLTGRPDPMVRPAGNARRPVPGNAVAVIGMAGRFPDAPDLDRFWANLAGGVESLRTLSTDELLAAGEDPARIADPQYVPVRAVLDDAAEFDAGLFGYSPREAALIDPQQRLFLECAWSALEHAGHDPARHPGTIGVYGGATPGRYQPAGPPGSPVDDYQHSLATAPDHLTSRVSHKLGLTGPSVTVLTTCSTSLVAIHQACQALLGGECDLALAGGVSAVVPPRGYLYREGSPLSPDGRVRAFDAAAAGTAGGDGVGVVALRRLDDALADGDHVHAVIRGSAVTNAGADRVGYAAPSVSAEARVIATALQRAGVTPDTVGYVEAHGTATRIGDPIELAAMTKAFRDGTDRTGFCAVGSVKTNIGHTDAAAGVAGFLKAVLALEHRLLPPSLHFVRPNPEIDFAGSPFYVNTELTGWKGDGGPRRAGVSSFGIGGTNAHVVLEEAVEQPPARPGLPRQLLVLSAATPSALRRATEALAAHLRAHPEQELADVAHTLQAGRRELAYRRFVVCGDRDHALRALTTAAEAGVRPAGPDRPVVFLLPGSAVAGGELYEHLPAFRARIDACRDLLGVDPHTLLDPARPTGPVQFAGGYALAGLLTDLGVTPAAIIGHGVGELVAACLSGTLALPDALCKAAATGGGPVAPEQLEDRLRALAPETLLVEVGPGHTLVTPAGRDTSVVVIPLPGRDPDALSGLLTAIGRLWQAGVPIDWTRLHHERRRRVSLPGYPFERRRYLIEPAPAVPTPASTGPASAAGSTVSTAAAIAAILAEVLGRASVGERDDFFDLGGDSLSAAQAITRVREAFGVEMALDTMFDQPTAEELARVVADLLADPAGGDGGRRGG